MGILVICSYKPKPGREIEALRLMSEHVPLLRSYRLVTERPLVQGLTKDGAMMEIFEWADEEKSRSAPTIAEIGAHWKAMSEVMDFVPLASLPEAQRSFAHFMPL